MKSPMVMNLNCIKDKENYSELQVLKSAAGYYIGTIYTNPKPDPDDEYALPEGYPEPGSRDSRYFASKADADAFLEWLEGMTEEGRALVLRSHP